MEIGQSQPLLNHAIEVRGAGSPTAVASEIAVSQIVRHNKHDVRTRCGVVGHGRLKRCRRGDAIRS